MQASIRPCACRLSPCEQPLRRTLHEGERGETRHDGSWDCAIASAGRSMRKRAEAAGGSLEIESELGKGTAIRATFPTVLTSAMKTAS